MSFKEVENVKFELVETITNGVRENKHGGYVIPVTISDEKVRSKIGELVKRYKTRNPLYGFSDNKKLYLKSEDLSEKQKEELLDKGPMFVLVHFETSCVYTNEDSINYLCLRVTKLRKFDKPPPELPEIPKPRCPED